MPSSQLSSVALTVAAVALILALFTAHRLQQRVSTRRYLPERQDLSMEEGRYTLEEFEDMMSMLSDINYADWSGGYKATMEKFESLNAEEGGGGNFTSVLEIGFGRGDFSIQLAQHHPGADVLGIDAHELSVHTARANLASLGSAAPPNVRFELRPAVELSEPPSSFDVITTTLVNHHIFPDASFLHFLRRVRETGRRAFVFSDLERSGFCYAKTVAQTEALRVLGGGRLAALGSAFLWSLAQLSTLLAEVIRLSPVLGAFIDQEQEQVRAAVRYMRIFGEPRPGTSLILDGAVASVERAFTREELRVLFLEAGFAEDALQCSYSGDGWLDLVNPCRMTCVADLR